MLSKQKKHIWLCLFFLFPKGRFGSIAARRERLLLADCCLFRRAAVDPKQSSVLKLANISGETEGL